jgi:hypothetical protein
VDCEVAPGDLEYAVKFVCGWADGGLAAPGQYFTTVNVHNPVTNVVRFRKEVAVAMAGQRPGSVSPFVAGQLEPDQAFAVECGEIGWLAGAGGALVEGFLVIQSPAALDVVAVYTGGRDRTLSTPIVERVPAPKAQVRRRSGRPRPGGRSREAPFGGRTGRVIKIYDDTRVRPGEAPWMVAFVVPTSAAGDVQARWSTRWSDAAGHCGVRPAEDLAIVRQVELSSAASAARIDLVPAPAESDLAWCLRTPSTMRPPRRGRDAPAGSWEGRCASVTGLTEDGYRPRTSFMPASRSLRGPSAGGAGGRHLILRWLLLCLGPGRHRARACGTAGAQCDRRGGIRRRQADVISRSAAVGGTEMYAFVRVAGGIEKTISRCRHGGDGVRRKNS